MKNTSNNKLRDYLNMSRKGHLSVASRNMPRLIGSTLLVASLPVVSLSAQVNCNNSPSLSILNTISSPGFTISTNRRIFDMDGDGVGDFTLATNRSRFMSIIPGSTFYTGYGTIINPGFTFTGTSTAGLVEVPNGLGATPINQAGGGTINNATTAQNNNNASTSFSTRIFSFTTSDGGTGFISFRLSGGNVIIESYGYTSTPNQDLTFLSGADCPNEIPLPVELTTFTAKAQKDLVALAWQTATEENNAGFEIERSTDGRNFRNLGFVEGNGNTAERQDYTYNDKDVKGGQLYYYRLKQLDFDGQFEYSDIIKVQTEGKSLAATFAPNPSRGDVQLQYFAQHSGQLFLQVFDASGKEMHNTSLNVEEGENNLPLDLSELTKGIYFVKMEQDGKTGYEKLVIE